MLDVSIVIVTYNSEEYISKCLNAIASEIQNITYEIIVVDNCSTDSTPAILQTMKNVVVINNFKNEGFAAANNHGIKAAKGRYILVLNPDILITAHTDLKEIFTFFDTYPDTGLVAPRLLYEDGSVQESARPFPYISTFTIRGLKLERHFRNTKFYQENNVFKYLLCSEPVEVDWVIGAFMVIPRKVLREVSSFDTKFFMYYEDADLCRRIKQQGYKVIYHPKVSAIHSYRRESAKPIFSRLKFIHMKSFLRFLIKRQLKLS